MFNMFNPDTLLISLIWGSVGSGFCLYGKKQGAMVPLVGGILLVLVSCFVTSGLWMSLACIALIAGMVGFMKLGY